MAVKRSAGRRVGARLGRIVLYMLVVLLLLAGINIYLANRRSFPEPKELAKVSLELRGVASPSRALEALLGERGRGFDRYQKTLKEPLRRVRRGQWLRRPEPLLEVLGALHRPSLQQFRRAVAAKGCLPQGATLGKKGPDYRYLILVRGARLSALRAIALAQTGRVAQAFRELGPIHDRFVELRRDCAPSLFGAIVIDTALRWILPAWGYLLAIADGSDDKSPPPPDSAQATGTPATGPSSGPASLAELQAGVWQRLRDLEVPIDGLMANALRHEHRYVAAYFEGLVKQPEKARGQAEQGLVWPWFDAADTLRIQRVLSARQVWLAGKPLTDPAWARSYPETKYLAEVRQGGVLSLFRYNQAGKVLLAIARPDFRRYQLKLVQTRCIVAALRAHWSATLKQRGSIVPAQALTPPPRNPFTKQPFAAVGKEVCGLPKSLQRIHGPLTPEPLMPLPPTPTAARDDDPAGGHEPAPRKATTPRK